MASSNIKLFDENKGNMLSDTEFNISNQRKNGLQAGIASSQLQNKAMYQASLVAYAIAQVMMQNGKNANDTDTVSTFVSNLSGTMLQKVYDIATTAEAQAGVATGKWMSPALVKAAMNYMLANPVTFGSTVTLARDPSGNLQAATKRYVDNKVTVPVNIQYELIEAFNVVFTSASFALQKDIIIPNGRIREIMLCVKAKNLNFTCSYSDQTIGPGIYYGTNTDTGIFTFGRESNIANLSADLTFRFIPVGNNLSNTQNTLYNTFMIAAGSVDNVKVISFDKTKDMTFRLYFYSDCHTFVSAEYDCELYVLR